MTDQNQTESRAGGRRRVMRFPFRRRLVIHEIKSATRLRLQPGDTVVLSHREALSQEEVGAIRAHAEEALPGVRCVVLSGGLELRAVLYEGGREAA